ncbi:MAG: proline--tRNA ligase, partial [Candidatus Dadabacteria bacterium]
ALLGAGIDACIDDRNERPGVKLSDIELIGIPIRVVFGRRSFERGVVEITTRRDGETIEAPVDDAVEAVRTLLSSGR